MDRILEALSNDPACEGYMILSMDGKIQDSNEKLSNKSEMANSIFKIFYSIRDKQTSPKIFIQIETGYIVAYQTRGKIVIVQKAGSEVTT